MILSCFRSSKADEGALPYFQFGTQYEGTCLAVLTLAVGGKEQGHRIFTKEAVYETPRVSECSNPFCSKIGAGIQPDFGRFHI